MVISPATEVAAKASMPRRMESSVTAAKKMAA